MCLWDGLPSVVPKALLKPCCAPRCPNLIQRGRRFCDAHAKADRAKRTIKQRGMYAPNWSAISRAYRQAHPLCETCLERGRTVASQCVDHEVALARGGADDSSNYRALCASCHARKTALHDGGFGRPPTLAHGRTQTSLRTPLNRAPLANAGERGCPSANVAARGPTGGRSSSLGGLPQGRTATPSHFWRVST